MKQKEDKPILLIMPDIHGRLFWLHAVKKYPNLPIIFLGDYLDPYTHRDCIFPDEALVNFKEILDFKKANMDRVTLLMGNHDIHYFNREMSCSRKDRENYETIHQLFSENLPLFKLAMSVKTNGKNFFFTHAGIVLGWLRFRMPEVHPDDADDICSSLNERTATEESFHDFVINGLMDASASRWGYASYPSPVWADVSDHQLIQDRIPNVYQIFGHTQQRSEPVITEQYACLDCRKAFLLTSAGNIVEA